MIIAHNLSAMNAQRTFGLTDKKKVKSMERLSSGYKVNRAADDAAGLSISEKLRRQIRGLKQGEDNIQEGISLVQVAEGALGEITECIQRLNELSIKAYNDTNQKQDREYIQQEVNQLITEIQRIADTTSFNEIPLLKGNPVETTVVEEGKTYTGIIYKEYEAQVPDWLKVSQTLDKSNSSALVNGGYGSYSSRLDTTTNAVFQTSPGNYVYYGARNAEYDGIGYNYGGTWSTNLADKASAVIDFSGLANVTTAAQLYNNLYQLIGTSIGVPCGTCTEYYGISFTGAENGLVVKDGSIKTSNGDPASSTYLNLSDWTPYAGDADPVKAGSSVFQIVEDMMRSHAMDTTKPDSEKQAEAQQLANELVEKITAESNSRLSTTINAQNHFNRCFATNDGKLVIYDYRDPDKLSNESTADSLVQTTSKAWAQVPQEMLKEGDVIEIHTPLNIQCSSDVTDKIPLELPLIDNETMGIAGYNIAFYNEKKVYSDEYAKKLADWKKNGGYHYEEKLVTLPASPAKTLTRKVHYLDYDRNGERVMSWKEETVTIPAVPERTVKQIIQVMDKPIPKAGPNDVTVEYIYNPSSEKTIADALAYISGCRSDLGATQNRLEHAYSGNLNTEENTTAAESRIRDTDMANEMVAFSNHNILSQVGQAMMAQANQSNQGVLNLLG